METNTTTAPQPTDPPTTLFPREDLPEFLVLFATLHDAMCRDAERLVRVAPHVSAGDLRQLHDFWTRYEQSIVHHHEREDQIVFPRLAERAPTFDEVRRVLHEEHLELDDAMAALGTAIAHRDLAGLQPASARFRDVLVRHLAREEHVVFPALAAHFTADEYAALEEELQKGSTLRQMAFELPWILDGTGDRFDDLVAEVLPAPIRLLNRALFTPRYRRLSAALRP